MSRLFLWLAIIAFSLFGVFTLVTAYTIVASAQAQWEEREVTPPTATLILADLDMFVRGHPFLFAFADFLIILLLVYKERRVSHPAALFINAFSALIGGALVLFFVFGLPILLYLPIFKLGPMGQ